MHSNQYVSREEREILILSSLEQIVQYPVGYQPSPNHRAQWEIAQTIGNVKFVVLNPEILLQNNISNFPHSNNNQTISPIIQEQNNPISIYNQRVEIFNPSSQIEISVPNETKEPSEINLKTIYPKLNFQQESQYNKTLLQNISVQKEDALKEPITQETLLNMKGTLEKLGGFKFATKWQKRIFKFRKSSSGEYELQYFEREEEKGIIYLQGATLEEISDEIYHLPYCFKIKVAKATPSHDKIEYILRALSLQELKMWKSCILAAAAHVENLKMETIPKVEEKEKVAVAPVVVTRKDSKAKKEVSIFDSSFLL